MSKVDPFVQKVVLTVLAAAAVFAAQTFAKGASDWFMMAGGTIFGWAWMGRPGDSKDEAPK